MDFLIKIWTEHKRIEAEPNFEWRKFGMVQFTEYKKQDQSEKTLVEIAKAMKING